MKKIFSLFGFVVVNENDLDKLEKKYNAKVQERIELFINPDKDAKVWRCIKALFPFINEETKFIYGVKGESVAIPISHPSGGFGELKININEMPGYQEFGVGGNESFNVVFIGNENIWSN